MAVHRGDKPGLSVAAWDGLLSITENTAYVADTEPTIFVSLHKERSLTIRKLYNLYWLLYVIHSKQDLNVILFDDSIIFYLRI